MKLTNTLSLHFSHPHTPTLLSSLSISNPSRLPLTWAIPLPGKSLSSPLSLLTLICSWVHLRIQKEDSTLLHGFPLPVTSQLLWGWFLYYLPPPLQKRWGCFTPFEYSKHHKNNPNQRHSDKRNIIS